MTPSVVSWEVGSPHTLWTCDPRCMVWEEVTMETVDDESMYKFWEMVIT